MTKWIVLVVLMASGSLMANQVELAAIVEQQRIVAAELDAGKLVMTPRDRNTVQLAQREVFAIAEGKTSLAELNIAEKTRLENALERINAVVKGGRRSQETKEVCWRERKTGSNMMVTRCGTQQEIDQDREGARGYLARPRTCAASPTASCGQ